VTGADIQQAIDNDEVVIFFDARSFPEYEGTDDRDNPRHGHIPGAIHYEWTNVYSESGQLRDKEELRAEIDAAGLLDSGALVIPYCQGGFRSAVAYSILRWLGQEGVSNYDGSWYEYARANDLPVDTP
jgi:thiosulfate/3-mercaptopyruvate sulfurtransferase